MFMKLDLISGLSRFLDGLHSSPDARPPVQYIDDENLVYIMQRFITLHFQKREEY